MKNPAATAAFIADIVKAQALLKEIQDQLDNHLGVDPDSVDWAHAGEAGRVASVLQDLADSLKGTGEYAL